MKTFRIQKLTLPPDQIISVEMSIKEFGKLASKEDWSPLLENSECILYIDTESRVMYFCKKKVKEGGER